MMEVARDFRDESLRLYEVLAPLSDEQLEQKTAFKGWTICEILGHLHLWNWVAELSYNNGEEFLKWIGPTMKQMVSSGIRSIEDPWLAGFTPGELRHQWHQYVLELSDRFYIADPEVKVKWAGPDMKLGTSVTARLMETWSHSQAIYDALGIERVDKDYIQPIAFLGVKTFSWAYVNRGLEVPEQAPCVKLTAPSGEQWQWNAENASNSIEGSATEFCQIVTQTRNIEDTNLKVVGEVAQDWVKIIQCFAGPPEDPPAPGTRGPGQPRQ